MSWYYPAIRQTCTRNYLQTVVTSTLTNVHRSKGDLEDVCCFSELKRAPPVFAGPLYDPTLDTCTAGRPRRVRYYTVYFEHTARKLDADTHAVCNFNAAESTTSGGNDNSNSARFNEWRLDHLSSRQFSRRLRGGNARSTEAHGGMERTPGRLCIRRAAG